MKNSVDEEKIEILYLSSACYRENKKKIDETSKIKLENNIINFHNSIIEGLSFQKNVNMSSIIGLPISICTNKKILWKKEKNSKDNIKYIQVGFVNLPIIKQITVANNIYKCVKKHIKNNLNKNIVIIYDASFVSIMPKIDKLINKYKLKSIGIFADIYDYMCNVKRKSNKNSFIKNIYRRKMRKIYNNSYGYVFLTKYMNELINIKNKPYIIMEGITTIQEIENKYNEKNNAIMYAGGLYEKYGVKNLIDAFKLIDDKNIELHLYGKGDLINYIEKIDDNRIKFFGIVDNSVVRKEEMKAKLLINPRFTDAEYTKYSFPSKLIEYMSSGTPVLTTKLLGIPKEYFKYLYLIQDESVKGIKNKIEEVLNINNEELRQKGESAKKFVLNYKNNLVQGKRIIELINN